MFVTKRKSLQTLFSAWITLTFAAMVLLSGCGDDSVTSSEGDRIAEIIIQPDSVGIEVGSQVDFSAFLIDDTGDTVETDGLNIEWNWWSSNTEVFTVEPGGLATAHSAGEEYCIVEVTVLKGSSNFNGRDSALVFIF